MFIGGGEFWSLMKIKLMLLPQPTYCSQEVANFDPSWRYSWCYYPNQHIVYRGWQILTPHGDNVDVITPINIVYRGWQILTPHGDNVDVITPINILFIGGGEFWSLMKIKLMLLPQPTLFIGGGKFWCDYCMIMMIVSVEQRPGWGEHRCFHGQWYSWYIKWYTQGIWHGLSTVHSSKGISNDLKDILKVC